MSMKFDKQHKNTDTGTNSQVVDISINRGETVNSTLQNKKVIKPIISNELLKALDILRFNQSMFWPLPEPKNKIDTVYDILKYWDAENKEAFFFESPYFYMDPDALEFSSLATWDMKHWYVNDDSIEKKVCHGDYISWFLWNNLVIHSIFTLNNWKELWVINAQRSQKHTSPVFIWEAIKYKIGITEAKRIQKDELWHERVFVKIHFIVLKMNLYTWIEEVCVKDWSCNVIFFE